MTDLTGKVCDDLMGIVGVVTHRDRRGHGTPRMAWVGLELNRKGERTGQEWWSMQPTILADSEEDFRHMVAAGKR